MRFDDTNPEKEKEDFEKVENYRQEVVKNCSKMCEFGFLYF